MHFLLGGTCTLPSDLCMVLEMVFAVEWAGRWVDGKWKQWWWVIPADRADRNCIPHSVSRGSAGMGLVEQHQLPA